MSSKSKASLVTIRLYRNLLRTAKPFTAPSPDASVLTCLLHRSGVDDHIQDWDAFVSREHKQQEYDRIDRARDLTQSFETEAASKTPNPRNNRTYQRLFRRLLREVVTGTNGYGKMVFPSQANTSRLKTVIQREFRANLQNAAAESASASASFDEATRQKVAFTALRELHKKMSYYDWLKQNNPEPIPNQASWRVSNLPVHPPASYLRPGVFLVSHPFMHDSYFSKSVICILEHKGLGSVLENSRYSKRVSSESSSSSDDNEDDDDRGLEEGGEEEEEESHRITRKRSTTPPGQTYGVIVNRVSKRNDTGEHQTIKEVFREHMLPERMADVFGDSVVREGGPVHVALQMIHSVPSPSLHEDNVGGTVIPFVSNEENDDDDESPALYSDRATYFQGNIFKTMSHVEKGQMDRGTFFRFPKKFYCSDLQKNCLVSAFNIDTSFRFDTTLLDDVSFFVGASIWSPGQLAAEIAQGYWIPCRGPPEMALDGICEHEHQDEEPTTSTSTSTSTSTKSRPLADLWLSMMSACGTDEAKLSHLFHHDHWDENGMPCDDFDDDDEDIIVL